MFDQITVAYVTALFLIFMGYVAGYVVGRLDVIYSALRLVCRAVQGGNGEYTAQPQTVVERATSKSRTFQQEETAWAPTKPIDINTAKFVAPVSTAGMERAGSGELGKTTAVQDDIGASVSKLSQLKGK
jgi:hypothetical protein